MEKTLAVLRVSPLPGPHCESGCHTWAFYARADVGGLAAGCCQRGASSPGRGVGETRVRPGALSARSRGAGRTLSDTLPSAATRSRLTPCRARSSFGLCERAGGCAFRAEPCCVRRPLGTLGRVPFQASVALSLRVLAGVTASAVARLAWGRDTARPGLSRPVILLAPLRPLQLRPSPRSLRMGPGPSSQQPASDRAPAAVAGSPAKARGGGRRDRI